MKVHVVLTAAMDVNVPDDAHPVAYLEQNPAVFQNLGVHVHVLRLIEASWFTDGDEGFIATWPSETKS